MVSEFGGYLRANHAWIPNYGERYRNGEVISSAGCGASGSSIWAFLIGGGSRRTYEALKRCRKPVV